MSAGILLCAGSSTRFGSSSSKLTSLLYGRPLVSWAIDHLAHSEIDEFIVVTGAHDLSELIPPSFITIQNDQWDSGQATSMQAGIKEAERRNHDVVIIGLGDQPFIPSSAWNSVANTESPIAIASFTEQSTPPVRLEQQIWSLLPRTGDTGARTLIKERPDLVTKVSCQGRAQDIDTPETLQQLNNEPPLLPFLDESGLVEKLH